MDKPPEWAIKQVENALDNQANNESIVQSFARALATTAERVERETIERCFEIANLDRRSELAKQHNHTPLAHRYAMAIATAIRSLPAKYGKATV